jgi:hypothetical protein
MTGDETCFFYYDPEKKIPQSPMEKFRVLVSKRGQMSKPKVKPYWSDIKGIICYEFILPKHIVN